MNKNEFYLLIEKYLAGEANLEEEQQLLNFLDSFQESSGWDERAMGVKDALEKKMLSRLMKTVREERQVKEIKVIPYRIWKNIAAAIAVFVVSGSLYLALQKGAFIQEENKIVSQFQDDISSGGNQALLTLADGSTIVLNDAEDGLIAEQGSTSIKKTADGRLAYLSAGLFGSMNEVQLNTIRTPAGGQYQITLPDGTKVWLNATSSLKFPTAFTGNERNVELSGEAYFEVAKFSLKGKPVPFYVNTSKSRIAVLGTHFNVMSYPDEDIQETTLLEGSVRVNGKLSELENSKILRPGQQAKLSSKYTDIKVVNDVNIESVMGWKTGVFLFESVPIEEVMRRVQRWYDAEVIYEGTVPKVSFTGVLPRSDYASKLLNILESAGGAKFEIEGKKIIVKKK